MDTYKSNTTLGDWYNPLTWFDSAEETKKKEEEAKKEAAKLAGFNWNSPLILGGAVLGTAVLVYMLSKKGR
jgi:hypothetical protein